MSALTVLRIMLHDKEIGTLAQLPDDRNLFVFNENYIHDPMRSTLSLSYKDKLGGLISHTKPTQTRLPAFFSNLLPEGRMREYLAERALVKSEREFFLLWMLGQDLSGAIKVLPVDKDALPKEVSRMQEKRKHITQDERVLRFSLAGVQLKFSCIKKARGGLTIPVDGIGGSWIVKLPDTHFKGVPENEFVMMELARRIGIDVPETMLVPLDKIVGLPKGIEQAGRHAYAIKRFDRTEDGRGIHIEDFAQIFSVYPEKKYSAANYRNIAEVIWVEMGEVGIVEFMRRFIFNALIGNADMHVKNWSIIYPDGRTAALAPAYDFLSTIPYIRDDEFALKFVDSKAFDSLTVEQLNRFSAKVGVPKKLILDTTMETIENFQEHWKNINDLGLSKDLKKIINTHLKKIPLYRLR
uniref:Serine/threonine-protein kinase HipA n=2 Tax=Candidatus Berkiella cookevillensis TaxID=437022 RepID=A0A0Q9YV48_9GAMM|nr:type II toxin-antitoxin system HipA family toxin [Candidatus Berkiella cookevillensis]